jgi:head-tail adaptor
VAVDLMAMIESVIFEAPAGVADAFGGETVAWSQVHACRAEWIYARGDESVQAARQAGRQAYKVKIRSCAAARDLTTDHRMRDARRGTVWNITECDAITNRAWVYLVVEGAVV